jgi:hypothetical protein
MKTSTLVRNGVSADLVDLFSSGLYLIFHAVAFALDNLSFGVMQEAVEKRRRKRTVVVEDFRPVFEGFV